MESEENTPKSKLRMLMGNGFFLGMVVGLGIGIAVDNIFIMLGLALALGLAWYAGKRKTAAQA